MEIKGYIFDIDGTLLDSTNAHLHAWRRALRDYGIFKTDLEISSQFGLKTMQISQNLAGENMDLRTIHEIADLKTTHLLTELEKVIPYPRASEILKKISQQYGKICFVSNNFNRIIEKMLTSNSWDQFAVGYIGVDDVQKAKPDPEMIHQALQRLNLAPQECVMIGDSKYDILAGQAAGTKTIAICTKHPAADFADIQPDIVLEKIEDLENNLPLIF